MRLTNNRCGLCSGDVINVANEARDTNPLVPTLAMLLLVSASSVIAAPASERGIERHVLFSNSLVTRSETAYFLGDYSEIRVTSDSAKV